MGETNASTLTAEERRLLLQVARQAIAYNLAQGSSLQIDAAGYPPALEAQRASFVTLHRRGELCGCIGSLEPRRPLVEDVAHNAHAAAFDDHRFESVQADDLPDLTIHISILSPSEPMSFCSEADLLRQLRPGVDGLILEEQVGVLGKRHRGTFLPAVWETLPEREIFWRHLKRKAGLPEDYWSDTLRVWRYTVESVES